MDFKGSKTENNLQEAFCIESKKLHKYIYFASQAQKDGYEQISRIFEEIANNKKEHVKICLKLLLGNKSAKTSENLKDAAENEYYEWMKIYPKFAKDAENEGFNAIAYLFEHFAKIKKNTSRKISKVI
ncbi:MAG: rubrerythrin family protein [Candidatus Gastranaerophilaceae bacterium]